MYLTPEFVNTLVLRWLYKKYRAYDDPKPAWHLVAKALFLSLGFASLWLNFMIFFGEQGQIHTLGEEFVRITQLHHLYPGKNDFDVGEEDDRVVAHIFLND
jgi:hypothetical protein